MTYKLYMFTKNTKLSTRDNHDKIIVGNIFKPELSSYITCFPLFRKKGAIKTTTAATVKPSLWETSIQGTPRFRGHLSTQKVTQKSLISVTVYQLQWREHSQHELSHLNRYSALVAIKHRILQRLVNKTFYVLSIAACNCVCSRFWGRY